MAGLTLADQFLNATEPFDREVVKRWDQQSDVLKVLPFKKIQGMTNKYRQMGTLPTIQTRRVGQAITSSAGRLEARQEDLAILAGQFVLDDALKDTERTGGDAISNLDIQTEMFMRAMGREVERQIFEGDKLVSTDEVLGLRTRLTGNQSILANATGTTLNLTLMNQLIDAVDPSLGKRTLWMNLKVARKLSTLVGAIGGSYTLNYAGAQDLTQLVTVYEGIPIHIVEDKWDRSTIMDFDEDPGDGTADTASAYCFVPDETMGFCGLINGDGPMVGLTKEGRTPPSDAPGDFYRTKLYFGTRYVAPRSAARLRGINNA